MQIEHTDEGFVIRLMGPDDRERVIPLEVKKIDILYKSGPERNFIVNVYLHSSLVEDNRKDKTPEELPKGNLVVMG